MYGEQLMILSPAFRNSASFRATSSFMNTTPAKSSKMIFLPLP